MKTKTMFVCQNCGAQSPRWIGKCAGCESWNSYVEESVFSTQTATRTGVIFDEAPVRLHEIKAEDERRLLSGIKEVDRALGGGIVPGSVTLIGGDPGIGKSTLTLQIACSLSKDGHVVLYVSGEESVKQTKMRSDRLSAGDKNSPFIVNQVDLNAIKEYISRLKPEVVIIDSIQVVFHPEVESSPGSVSQVRECSAVLTHMAKKMGIALFIIGHVTKEGMLAGPRVMEHIVDTVLYFEGEKYTSFRVIRATKNRFGSTNELGIFEMTSCGLKEVLNPSDIFLAERPRDASGSVVVPIMEGTRPFLVEVQGLVSRSSFGMVRQKAQGFDSNRMALLVAVLEKRMGMNLGDKDIFLNIVGGFKVMDPAADLGVVLSIASALLDTPVAYDTAVLGEVGLSAEVRSVSQLTLRLNEADKLGFKRCIIPANNANAQAFDKDFGLEITAVENVKQALDCMKR